MNRSIAWFVVFFSLAGAALAQSPAASPATEPAVKMEQLDVTASRQAQLNTIDRKVYSLANEIQASTGSAADVLQNIPSVDVDIDGNVSLRGDTSVQILIDGRSSAMMAGTSRADILSQLPADSIDHIEVITNPSAKYKPDGSGGIINIVLKKKRAKGYSGTAKVTVGNNRRYGFSVGANYNPGPFNLFGNYAVRQDDRPRSSTDRRNYIDPATGLPASTQTTTAESGRPFFQIAQAGIDYNPGTHDKLREVFDLTDRTFTRHVLEHDLQSDNLGALTTDYFRYRYDPEHETQLQSKSSYEHDFGRPDQTLTLEFQAHHHTETESDHYTNLYRAPAGQVGPPEFIRILTNEPGTEMTAEYSDAIGKRAQLELGIDRSEDQSHMDHADFLQDPATGLMVPNPLFTNSFYVDQIITAFYGTFQQSWGDFSVLAGGRAEEADISTNQITSNLRGEQRYFRFYPSLHLTYDLSPTRQVQFNYSHRVRRPDRDDLNPYPENQDPYNVKAGNPDLKPQETHSIEAGYQYKNDDTTYLGTLYYRYTYNSFTQVSRYISSSTLLTTQENLGQSNSGGLELAATTSPIAKVNLNASGNIYYNQIDASNLGFTAKRSTIAESGKLGIEYAWTKSSVFQFNSVYTGKRLTPQGEREPTIVANVGFRHDFKNRKVSLLLTVSDVFNSLKDETKLDTPLLHDDLIRRRSARIFAAGLVYNFGTGKKAKGKSDSLQFDSEQ